MTTAETSLTPPIPLCFTVSRFPSRFVCLWKSAIPLRWPIQSLMSDHQSRIWIWTSSMVYMTALWFRALRKNDAPSVQPWQVLGGSVARYRGVHSVIAVETTATKSENRFKNCILWEYFWHLCHVAYQKFSLSGTLEVFWMNYLTRSLHRY